MKSAADMTVEEFGAELAMLRDDVYTIKDSKVGKRVDLDENNPKELKNHLRVDALGRPRGGKYDG